MKITRVPVNPDLLRWARERSGIAYETLATKFKRLPEWEGGTIRPTIKQLEAFARAVHVPVGYLFLTKRPSESVPIPDFRTFAGKTLTRLSPNLLDTIYTCEERQIWYRDFARASGQSKLSFVGSATIETPPKIVAEAMRTTLNFDLPARERCSTWMDALRSFVREIEQTGILVMINGVVGSNTHRRLDLDEFRGFALSDAFAPLIFVNGRDAKAAHMFTLAHELAHIWLGTSALSNHGIVPELGYRQEETWCNSVAAELLVPSSMLRAKLRSGEALPDTRARLVRAFKVSSLVVLRRLLDIDWIDRHRFDIEWRREIKRIKRITSRGAGGNFYRTTAVRVSRRFARAIVISALEGHTVYRNAFRMLGIEKSATFDKLVEDLNI